MLQVFIETEAETYHADIEEDARWQEDARQHVQPLAPEGARMGVAGYNRVSVQQDDDALVA